jgi:choline dehydrogenase-like flavoprotein
MESTIYDVIIVGGGIAGCILAARLSEDPGLEVLVIEAGADQLADPRVNIPALWHTLLNGPADWTFRTTPQVRLMFPTYLTRLIWAINSRKSYLHPVNNIERI